MGETMGAVPGGGPSEYWAEERLVGESPYMRGIKEQIEALAPLGASVLLTGETGTGKGCVARAIHAISPRRHAPFVHVDCAALAPTLFESELFGHEKGAFTNAMSRRPGRFELAGAGTIFLDEIGDLAPVLQSKLLRVLEDRRFERLGGGRTLPMRARVIAATSCDIDLRQQDGRFRADLFFRLNVFRIHLPSLRARRQDLDDLVEFGLQRAARRHGVAAPPLTPQDLAYLRSHRWPGNVRELFNWLERRLVYRGSADPAEDPAWAEPETGKPDEGPCVREGTALGLCDRIQHFESREIRAALVAQNGNIAAAARSLGIPRGTLRYKMRKYRLIDLAPMPAGCGEPDLRNRIA